MGPMMELMEGGYNFVSRFRSHVAPEVYLADAALDPIRGQRVLIEHAKRARPDYAQLQALLYSDARAQPAYTHPNLTAVIDFFEAQDGLYLVLEHVQGSSLHAVNGLLRAKAHALEYELSAYVMRELLNGLHHLHTCPRADSSAYGTILEQLFPERVRISNDGEVKLANTGLMRVLARPENEHTGPERFGYFSVEWIAGEQLSVMSNVYTAGVMLFELLLGRSCFVGKTMEDIMQQVATRGVRVRELIDAGVPQALCNIVERATRLVPEQRYSSAGEMSQALDDWLADRSAQNSRPAMADFLSAHGLVGKAGGGEPDTVDMVVEPKLSDVANPSFGLRKPARRSVTKVGLRHREK
jgi:serine/threonine-protein kinase